ncbi:hypothetical protein Pla175_09450 [Pirellulimonas nuda]|uniref:Uncharacterized protein n=1 Tax=Pirellulimonas nuda TaxID=2528009 RepID=A0A518D806_9BACT|nr:hypothetical protein [Pirellulimonas nuda]QDU87580.1 hypothetical protein Pla175_09450 [Pirellulimonas nuda]
MGIGPAIIGAIVGALVGAAAQAGIELGMNKEASWMAIVIGLFAGIGAWKAAGASIHKISYLRGALAALVALGGIIGAAQAISAAAVKRSADAVNPVTPETPRVVTPEAGEGEGEGEEATEPAEPEVAAAPAPAVGQVPADFRAGNDKGGPPSPNPYQFVFIAVGVFLAYEFARGHKPADVEATPAEEPPVA